MKKNVLFVGDNPVSRTGNGNMLAALASQIDTRIYNATCFVTKTVSLTDPFNQVFNIIDAEQPGDKLGSNKLLNLLQVSDINYLIFVGLDIWEYAHIFKHIIDIKAKKKFCWIAIFPYDIIEVRKDWIAWMNCLDIPCVYSKYGYNMLKSYVPKLQYFRPPMWSADAVYKQYDLKKQMSSRHQYFKELSDSDYIIGCIAKNQIRKDIPKLIKAYLLAKKERPNLVLYLHTEFDNGVYNLKQMAADLGAKTGDLISKSQSVLYSEKQMVDVYNSIDCLVNCSAQEGLSWTVLQAMCCGTPVIASRTTSQTEMVEDAGCLITPKEPIYIPVITKGGKTHVQAFTCRAEDIKQAIIDVSDNRDLQNRMIEAGLAKSKEWLDNVSNINDLLKTSAPSVIQSIEKKKRVLFAQHSAAGDVLMTTRCFKGISERYNLPIDYMTMPQYKGIVEDNPYIDKILPWNERIFAEYQFVLNPHGDRILPGSWGRNSTSILSDFYWKILDVVPDDFYIAEREIGHWEEIELPICIVQTSGGDKEFRTYRFMKDICNGLKDRYMTIQLGSKNDYPASAEIDLRGKTTFAETAWIMKQANLAVTIDSYLSHLAGALGISQVCLFGSGNYRVVRPNQLKGLLVCRVPDYTLLPCLGPCSASVRNCKLKCTGVHNPYDILNDIVEIEEYRLWEKELKPKIIERIS